jgi:UDP-N-acetylglucosamine:LPS N-acetylglucosamine transferase
VLQDASLFVTHHGLNSTHEAIYHRVPMISYPFSAGQQRLAARCQEFGLAIPLVDEPRDTVSPSAARAAFARLGEQAAGMETSLARARTWEIEVMGGRDAVIRRILELAGKPPG